jgi:hypothetical protein
MVNKRLFLVFFCVVLSVGLIVTSCRRHITTEDKVDRIANYLTDDLNLNTEQEDILQHFKASLIERINRIKTSHKAFRGEMLEEIRSDVMDREHLMGEVSLIRSEIDDTITFAVSGIAEFHQTLTKDQKEILVKKIEGLRKLHGCD